MSQFFLPHSLVDSYGGRFPSATELDHMMAIRGMLVRWVQLRGASLHARDEISKAITWVTQEIETYAGKGLKEIPNASEALLDHYRDFVSQCLDWLYLLWTLLPLDPAN